MPVGGNVMEEMNGVRCSTPRERLERQIPYCGTPELYDLALDYKITADKNYRQNLEDAVQADPSEGTVSR
jgi:hypothetical protein